MQPEWLTLLKSLLSIDDSELPQDPEFNYDQYKYEFLALIVDQAKISFNNDRYKSISQVTNFASEALIKASQGDDSLLKTASQKCYEAACLASRIEAPEEAKIASIVGKLACRSYPTSVIAAIGLVMTLTNASLEDYKTLFLNLLPAEEEEV